MAKQPVGVWGIDLGQCALKAVRLENIEGTLTATAFDYVEHPKILSQPDADPDQLTREAMEKFLSRNSIKGDLVAISIPGQSGLARFVKLPPVEEKKIPDIVKFEAKQQIPFNLEEVVWDYQKLNTGIVSDGFAMETEIGLFAIKRDTVAKYLQHFKDVNVEVHIVQMAPLALCNYVAYDLLQKGTDAGAEEGTSAGGKKKCVVALDIGADNSNLVITDGERIIWQRPIPLGGNHFTRALTKDMKLTFAKAEHLKRNATKSPELKQILSSLKPVLNDFVGEVQRSLGYFTNTHRDANIQYMMGLGCAFRLPGMQKFLAEKLQLDVRKLGKLERLVGDEVVNAPVYTENVLSFAVAYGLALQGLKAARLQTNLLPHEIRVERMIRAKKPWVVTAAASILLGSGILGIGYSRQHFAVASDVVKKEMDQVSTVKKRADGYETAFKGVMTQIEKDKDAVRSIIVGQEERFNWMHFNQFVNRAIPTPDGSNLNIVPTGPDKESAKQMYFKRPAQQAYAKLMALDTGKSAEAKSDEEEWRKDLVQANVESVYCVFSEDLATFVAGLSRTAKMDTMIERDRKLMPAAGDKGWVVEVRGYTYHKDGFKFVTKAVVENLARLPLKDGVIPAPDLSAKPAASATSPTAAKDAASPSTASTAAASADPITDRVSHVVLYDFKTVENPDPTQFEIIGSRVLDQLIGGGAAGAAPGAMSGGGAAGGLTGKFGAGGGGAGARAGGGPWSPLTNGTLGGGGGNRSGMNTAGPGTAPGGVKMGGRQGGNVSEEGGGGIPGGAKSVVRPGGDVAVVKKGSHTRTEFIVLFVWKEPTPSDALLQPETAAQ